MIASQAVRLVSASLERGSATPGSARRRRNAVSSHATRRRPIAAVHGASWDLRIFGLAIAAILFCFAIALVYVSQTTALSVAGYDVQKLAAQRDELRRQNSLLEVQSARLDSPARIAADAQRLGMVHARYVPVIPAQQLIAKR